METRAAERSDIRAIAELWSHAFPGGRTLAERVHALETNADYGGISSAVVMHVDGQLAGALKMYRMTQHIAGAALPMMGLAAVAIAPSARRRGLGAALCRDALRRGRERGDVVSTLYPFRPSFYRALGWGLAGELHRYLFRPESLAAPPERLPVRAAGGDDRPLIAACYARAARHSNGLIDRRDPVWRRHLDAPDTAVFVCGDGEVAGYVRVRYVRTPSPDERPLLVQELVAENDDAYASLLGWLGRQREPWRRIRYDAAPDEHFAHRLNDPRTPGYRPARRLWSPNARVIRGPMVRVLDVRAALERRTAWGHAPALSLAVRVRDPDLAANDAPLLLRHDAGVVRVTDGGGAADAELHTDAATFAQIYTGELGVRAAAWLGLAEVSGDVGAVDALFRTRRRFRLLDEF